jgi:septal ring factor EnvC (AmiA/AmiB activator)
MPEDTTDVTILIAIGRIEEKITNVQQSQERVEKKLDTHDARLTTVEHDITQLKTQRENKAASVALWLAVAAIAVSVITSLLP